MSDSLKNSQLLSEPHVHVVVDCRGSMAFISIGARPEPKVHSYYRGPFRVFKDM